MTELETRRIVWYERFRKVILKAGYSQEAAEKVLARYFNEYMLDLVEFDKMLRSYEENWGS